MRSLLLGALILSLPLQSPAANQAVLGNQLLVKNGATAAARKIVFKAKELGTDNTIVGDPTANGATLQVTANGVASTTQTYTLPIGTSMTTGKPFWSGDAVGGYKYKDPKGDNGPVKAAAIKKTASGVFQMKAVVDGKNGSITVLPPNTGTDACVRFTIGNGDTFDVRFASGVVVNKTTAQFQVNKPTLEGSCTRCDFLDPADCLFPFPSNYFTVADPTTDTGLRVHFANDGMPRNVLSAPVESSDYNRNDGFSPGVTILTYVPNVDLAMTGAVPITDIERSQEAAAPIVVVNATTLAHHSIWAEVDSNATSAATRAVIIHPAVNFAEGTRYIVALRNMKDAGGALLTPNADFVAYRDGTPVVDTEKEARRPHMEALFTTLAAAGIPRNDLYLAWDFTVASERNISERLLFARDDAFARLGSDAPTFVVTQVEDEVDSDIFRRVTGTFQVERYVDDTEPPARMVLDLNGLPVHQATPQPASFICNIPRAALANTGATAVPARASLYGHGLLGSNDEVSGGNVEAMANEHNFVFCATKWIGMSEDDVDNAVKILQNFSNFPTLTDRLQQAMVNQLFLARLMIHANGFVANPAFQDGSGNPVIDRSDVFYDGNSQGGIFGGTVMAIAQDITRGVLGVPGMNYSLLLTRSTDFALYTLFLNPSYPNQFHRPLVLALAQMLWDRSDPNGYAHHMTTDPLPNTPQHQVLLHLAFGDHQVANVATEVEARTIGASIRQPAINPGRHSDVNPYSGIPAIPSYPFDGSALVIFDSGAATPPITNTAPGVSFDPHSDPRKSMIGRQQKSDFLKTGGMVTDVCLGIPCVIPH